MSYYSPYSFSRTSINRGFTPTDISDLKGWWDASDNSTITESSSRVSIWADKSGNGYDQLQATGGNQPLLLSADQNGLDTIDFVGSRWMLATGEVLTQPVTYCYAGIVPADGTGTVAVMFRFGTSSLSKYSKTTTNDQIQLESATALNFTETGLDSTFQSQIIIANSTSSKIIFNDVTKVTGDAGTDNPTNAWYVQVNAASNNQFGNEKLGEMMVYEKLLDATEITQVNDYFVDKWGL